MKIYGENLITGEIIECKIRDWRVCLKMLNCITGQDLKITKIFLKVLQTNEKAMFIPKILKVWICED